MIVILNLWLVDLQWLCGEWLVKYENSRVILPEDRKVDIAPYTHKWIWLVKPLNETQSFWGG